ncbi:hypothetical protein M9458_045045, partial [Cirrhinus mrigala]
MPDAAVSVEDCLIAVSAAVGGANIRSASRMNKAIVFFLSESQMVDDLIESGLVINDTFVPVLPLSSPSKKVVLSNVPPFVKNEKLEQILQRYGKIASPIKMIPLGCRNQEIKHVMSFRRQTFMILNSQSDPLNLSAKLNIDGKDYTVFISSESMRCFVCGDFGHIRQTCPNRDRPAAGVDTAALAGAESSGGAAGADPAAAAVAPELQLAGAPSVPDDPSVERPLSASSESGPVVAVEEAAGPSQTSAAPHAGTSLGRSQLVPADSPQQINENENTITDDFITPNDISSQELLDLKGQMEDSDNDYEDIELTENDGMDTEPASGGKIKLYSLQQINHFLDVTKGLRKPKIESYFPDLDLFLMSCTLAMRKATFDELDKPKRYRLKKLLSNVRSVLQLQ